MKVRVLIGFEGYEAGQVFDDWPSGMCEGLIAMGAIEEVKEPAKEAATPDGRRVAAPQDSQAQLPSRQPAKEAAKTSDNSPLTVKKRG